ncbi:MAG: hypothetical protein ACYC11_03125 [Bellilinea sp.]
MSLILSSMVHTGLEFHVISGLLQEVKPVIPWWFWVIMAAALILLLWMLFNQPKEEDEKEDVRVETVKIPEPEPSPPQEEAFDLTEDVFDYETEPDGVLLDDVQRTPAPFLDGFDEEGLEEPAFEEFKMKPDDFTVIEGISSKISKLLVQSDIQSYDQLAHTGVDKLQVILASAGIFLTDPTSWPEQSRLAAEDRWDELKAYQEELKGG